MPYYDVGTIESIRNRRDEARQSFNALRTIYLTREYRCTRAKEQASQGFTRRLGTLLRCIDNVFRMLPPEREDIPDSDELEDAAINLQAFVVNAFGCCDNLAWIWVLECPVRRDDGRPLPRSHVGFRRENVAVRASVSPGFRDYLDTLEEWLSNLTDYRDALAHRIPLYIPPYVIAVENEAALQELQRTLEIALRANDTDAYERARAEQKALGRFRPWMKHSWIDESREIEFHQQMLHDFSSIAELAYRLGEELESVDLR